MLLNAALVVAAAAMVIHTYGLLSPSTAMAFFSISLCVLAVAARQLDSNIRRKHQAIIASESRHCHAGHSFRTFTDSHGTLWLRVEDIRRCMPACRPLAYLARKYPRYFRKANPLLDAWYVHPKGLRALVGPHAAEAGNTFLHFLEQRVIGEHYALLSIGGQRTIPEPAAPPQRAWVVRFWHGELGLATTLLAGGTALYATAAVFGLLYPEEFVLHYQWAGSVYLASIIATTALLFCWGHGLMLAALHWLASGRSVTMAMAATVLGGYLVILSLDPLIRKYDQYSLAEWLSIVADRDEKPAVYYDPGLQATVIHGPLGFGTTLQLLAVLEKAKNTNMIGLKSYGGRIAEGEAIHRIIRARKLDTYAWAECMSACVLIYAGGTNRYIASTAMFGLHRSGLHWDHEDNGPGETDLFIAEQLRNAGVQEWLILRGMIPSIHGIYEPSVQDVLDANLATERYDPR